MLNGIVEIALLALVSLCVQTSDPSAVQVVSGSVAALDGSAMPNALVEAVPNEGQGTVGVQHWMAAAKDGHFEILLTPGRYQIRAKAEAAGYPDPSFLFSVDPKAIFPIVLVGSQPITGVRVVVGAKGASLDGEVRDARSGAPVRKAKVTISDADVPHAYVEVFTNDGGQFHFVVPAKAITVSATAQGYRSQSLSDSKRLLLSQGERRAVVIQLHPESR